MKQLDPKLLIVHTDVRVPTKNLGGNRYFVTFIDNTSRHTAIYFMKSKDEILRKFKEFETMATNITGKSIKLLRSDNGGELLSKELSDFLAQKAITVQLTILRTPEQTG